MSLLFTIKNQPLLPLGDPGFEVGALWCIGCQAQVVVECDDCSAGVAKLPFAIANAPVGPVIVRLSGERGIVVCQCALVLAHIITQLSGIFVQGCSRCAPIITKTRRN